MKHCCLLLKWVVEDGGRLIFLLGCEISVATLVMMAFQFKNRWGKSRTNNPAMKM